MSLKSLLEKRQSLFEQMKDLQKQAEKNGSYTEEMRSQYEKMDKDFDSLNSDIDRERKLEAIESDMAEEVAKKEPEKAKKELEYKEVFAKAIKAGIQKNPVDVLTPEELKVWNEVNSRAQSTTDSAGGYTIPEDFMKTIETALTKFGGMREVSTVFRTKSGATMPMPTVNDTSNTGAWLDENTQESEQDLTFGVVNFGAYKGTSKSIRVSVELLQDSAFNLAAYIAERLGERVGRLTNTAFTTGDGSGKPTGVVTSATAGITASATAITRANILNLQYSVDPAYSSNGRYMFNNSTLAAIRALSFGTGDDRPLYQVSAIAGQPDLIEGKPFTVNQDMADIGASAVSMLYGDFSKYYIREVLPMTLVFFDEKYMDYYQKAYQLFGRWDGKLVDAGTHPVKKLTHAAS